MTFVFLGKQTFRSNLPYLAAFVALAILCFHPDANAATDVTGSWTGTLTQLKGGVYNVKMSLKQDSAGNISGTHEETQVDPQYYVVFQVNGTNNNGKVIINTSSLLQKTFPPNFNWCPSEVNTMDYSPSGPSLSGTGISVPPDECEPWTISLTKVAESACLFKWAETNYPALFAPSGSHTAAWTVYTYRYYSATNAYLAINSVNNHVYYMGPEGMLQDEGPLSYWSAQAGCQVPPPPPTECLFVWAETTYPDLFSPSGAAWAVSSTDSTYRYYQDTNAYLEVKSTDDNLIDNHLWYRGADGQLQDVGKISKWLTLAGCQ